jgi:hypothetical protein
MKQVVAPRYGLGLDALESPQALGGKVRGAAQIEMPPGRGYVVKSGRTSLIQVALPQDEANMEESLDAWVDEIIDQYPQPAVWMKDLMPKPEPEPEPEATPETVELTNK